MYAVVVYTGHESKIMKNSVRSKAKFSRLENATNRYIILMALIQIIICLIASTFSTIWTYTYMDDFVYLYLASSYKNFAYSYVVSFGTWLLSFMNLVPISLMVTLEMVKFV